MTAERTTTCVADGRKLAPHDSYFFDNCFAPLSGIFGFAASELASDAKLKDAYDKVIKMTPLLQTRVVGEGSEACFREIPLQSEWPQLLFTTTSNVATDTSLRETAKATLDKILDDITTGGQDAHRKSVRAVAVRNEKRVEIVVVVPHHFLDGTGMATLLAQLYAYARCPKFLWPLIDTLCPKGVPSYSKMLLKSDFETLNSKEQSGSVNVNLSPRLDPNNFAFKDYDFSDPTSKLSGIVKDIGAVKDDVLKQVCRSLRRSKVTLTSAFLGLAIKVLAVLLKKEGIELDASTPLLSSTGVDARGQGNWDSESKDKEADWSFPIAANYTYGLTTQISQSDALEQNVEQIAYKIRATIDRTVSDPSFRQQEAAASSATLLPTSKMFVGASSVIVPRLLTNVLGVHSDMYARIAFGRVPRVWFYIYTCGNETMMAVDVHLPLPATTEADVQAAILDSVHGSALQPLFASWSG